jgi:ABC-type phosphate/phosphonate transport system substrate-binding protein
LAAPLLSGKRYQKSPCYFVDVVGRVGDHADQRWAFNEKESFSGWLAVRQGLTDDNRSPDEIEWVKTGSHLASLEAVKGGAADRAGIDSMVIDLEPRLLSGLEVVSTWGPWPAPPLLAARQVEDRFDELRSLFASNEGGPWISLPSDHLAPIATLAAATIER